MPKIAGKKHPFVHFSPHGIFRRKKYGSDPLEMDIKVAIPVSTQ